MIFPELIVEHVLQVADRTRIGASKTYISKDEQPITLVEIEAEAGAGFVDVTGTSTDDWFLDWAYQTAGEKTVSLRVTTDGAPTLVEKQLTVLTVAEDNLFSTDQDLIALESEVLKYLPEGKNSFLNVHRKMQTLILDELDERGLTNFDGSRITKDQVVDVEEVARWSAFGVLWLIFQDLSNSTDDVFREKSLFFKSRMDFHRSDAFIRLDFNKDGEIKPGESAGIRTSRMVRR